MLFGSDASSHKTIFVVSYSAPVSTFTHGIAKYDAMGGMDAWPEGDDEIVKII